LVDLGLSDIPSKQNFNYFLKSKVSNEVKSLLDFTAEEILATATRNKKILDIEIVKKNIRDYKNKAREERKVLNESTKLIKKLIYPQIKLNIAKNSRFTTKDLLDILVHIAQTHDFAFNGTKTFQDLYEDKDVPNGKTFLYHLKKLNSKEDIRKTFENITDVIFNFARKNYNLLNRRKLDIAYDIHKIPFYGKNAEYIKDSKHERGTSHFYQFLTVDIVVSGKRFTIDVIPIHPLDNVEDLLNESLERVKKKVRINRVYLDRWFANSKYIPKLGKLNYIMPIQRSEKIKAWMDKSRGIKARLIEDFKIGERKKKVKTNLYLVEDKEGVKHAFITNLKVPVLLSHYLYTWYGKRWGIETGYRLKAQDFKPRTTSKNFTLRLFYFLFSTMLYNLWVLTNIVVGTKLYGKVPGKPLITAKRFSIILYKVQLDSGG
tara:strand:+ start:63 stop:1358 length:1296 start_codon:yes stop_codon:yes gene_type:complete